MTQLFFWKFRCDSLGNEREKREERKNLYRSLTGPPPWARVTPSERGRHAAPNATVKARFWLLHGLSRATWMAWRPLYANAWVIFFLNNILKPKITKTRLSKSKNNKKIKNSLERPKHPPQLALIFFNFKSNFVI